MFAKGGQQALGALMTPCSRTPPASRESDPDLCDGLTMMHLHARARGHRPHLSRNLPPNASSG